MFKISLKLIDSIDNVNRITRRSIGHKRLQRLKILQDHSYVPWKSAEAVESIEETLKIPYKQVAPTNPANHTFQDIGKFYTIPAADKLHYFQLGGLSNNFKTLWQIFNENAVMIRRPAVEIIECMEKANYDKLPVKYAIHGDIGCGKRVTKLHVLHYAFRNDFIVFDVPHSSFMFKFHHKEALFSETRPPFIDMPLEGALILKNFQLQNSDRVEDMKLKTTKNYVWNLRESTPAGVPLMELVNFGINRAKYACDCIDGLVDELKRAATEGEIKLLVAVDQFNSFLCGKSKLRIEDKRNLDPRLITIFQSVLRFLQPDWCNGAILTTLDEYSIPEEMRGSSFPFFLLKREGFEMLDPFIPVEVPKLSELEFHSMLDYYEDRRWLQKMGSRDELEFLSARVAEELRKLVGSL